MITTVLRGKITKSAATLAEESATKFGKDPALHGLSAGDGKLLSAYASKLLAQDSSCKYIIDGAKSSFRKDVYYVDCRNLRGDSERRWITRSELVSGRVTAGTNVVSDTVAIDICHKELRAKATNPSTYNPSTLGVTSRAIPATGRNVVAIEFSAKNGLGAESKFRGECLIENGRALETTIQSR